MIDGLIEEDAKTTQRMFFIDSENGMTTLMEGFEALSPKDVIVVFHRNTVPRKTRESLEMGPAAVEWIGCVDPGFKNSMDVQIISKLSMRCSQGGIQRRVSNLLRQRVPTRNPLSSKAFFCKWTNYRACEA